MELYTSWSYTRHGWLELPWPGERDDVHSRCEHRNIKQFKTGRSVTSGVTKQLIRLELIGTNLHVQVIIPRHVGIHGATD